MRAIDSLAVKLKSTFRQSLPQQQQQKNNNDNNNDNKNNNNNINNNNNNNNINNNNKNNPSGWEAPNTNTIQVQKLGGIQILILFGFRTLAEYEYEYYSG